MPPGPAPAKRVVAHLDCDAFYATVELLRRPELRGKPVIVSGTGPRAVVTTASYEARRYGIGSAMPTSRARRLCPQAVLVPPDFEAYRATSQEVWATVRDHLERVQQVGIDEGYADLTGVEKPLRVLRGVVAEVKGRTGVQLSVGVGPNRLVAKCCSDLGKPAGFVAMGREEACERFAASAPSRLPGIGPKTAERLASMGIATVADLQRADPEVLSARFGGRTGPYLVRRAQFHDSSEVELARAVKSRSSETTFDSDVEDATVLEGVVRRLAGEVAGGLRRRGRRGRTIGIKVRLDDWTTVTRARTIEGFTDEAELVAEVAVELLRAYAPPRPVRLLGVRIAGFDDAEPEGRAAAQGQAAPAGQLALPL